MLYAPSDHNQSISILKKGEVTLFYSHLEKKLIIEVMKKGAIFSNFNPENTRNAHYAKVTEDSYIWTFPLEDFIKVLQQKPELMMKFITIMARRLKEYEIRLKNGLFDAKEKILHQPEIIVRKGNFLNRIIKKNTKNHP